MRTDPCDLFWMLHNLHRAVSCFHRLILRSAVSIAEVHQPTFRHGVPRYLVRHWSAGTGCDLWPLSTKCALEGSVRAGR